MAPEGSAGTGVAAFLSSLRGSMSAHLQGILADVRLSIPNICLVLIENTELI
jgi:hypothetical protein